MKIRTFSVSFLYIFVFFAIQLVAQEQATIQQQLTNGRTGLYTNATPIAPHQLYTLYQTIQEAKTKEQRQQLTALWGILWAENTLIIGQPLSESQTSEATEIYQTHKRSLKNTTSDILQKTAEWSFAMMQVFPKKRHAYLMDTRMFLIKSLRQNKNNISSQVSLGKWWAYRIMSTKNHELNHSMAQSHKYLLDKQLHALIQNHPDPWTRIDVFNAYRMRSQMRFKSLDTQRSFDDMKQAQKILPNHQKDLLANGFPFKTILAQGVKK